MRLAQNAMNGTLSTHNTFAFIQARTGSTRLPKKVLRCLPSDSETTLLDHIFNRTEKVLPSDRIVFLIPKNDSELKNFFHKRNYLFFEGDETDVRERFIKATEKFSAQKIIRFTGDNPFIDTIHLELLLETLGDSDADLVSFNGLPIGMGAEIFTRNALLAEPDSGILDRHKEHVSLHIKEDSKKFKFVKINPILSKSEIEKSAKIRLTMDEEKDFEVLEKVYRLLKNQNPYFGATEVVSLYDQNPRIFEENKSVEQVKFSTSSKEMSKSKISIIYAPPQEYGYGHFERCKILFVKLSSLGYDINLSGNLFPEIDSDLTIIDYRDAVVPPKLRNGKVLLIDNFGPDRNIFIHHDVLPHPKLDLQDSLKNILFPDLLNYYTEKTESNLILTYANGRNEKESFAIDDYLYNKFGNAYEYIRIGGFEPASTNIQLIHRLSKKEFFDYLSKCSTFCTYFGQGLMEAIYLQKKILIYSISEYHTELGKYISEKSNLPFIGSLESGLETSFKFEMEKSSLALKNSGYKNLIRTIENIFTA